jgi:Flp pilus assembly protein TadG
MRRGSAGRSAALGRDRGAAAVEFALLFPVFLVMVCGIMDFGMLIYSQTVVNNAAREAVRAASLGATSIDANKVATSAAGALFGAPMTNTPVWTCTPDSESCTNFTEGGLTAAPATSTVTVTLTYDYAWITPLAALVPGLGSSKSLTGFSQMAVE